MDVSLSPELRSSIKSRDASGLRRLDASASLLMSPTLQHHTPHVRDKPVTTTGSAVYTTFIKQENQTVLWNTIQNFELFHQVLKPEQKPAWFKEIIGIFYTKYRDILLPPSELEILNRQIIQYMVSSLKSIRELQLQESDVSKYTIRQDVGGIVPDTSVKKVSFQENDTIDTISELRRPKNIQSQQDIDKFSIRQQEYEQMMKKNTPPNVNFKEEINNDVIKNMDELLEKQRKQRELDLLSITSPISKKLVIREQDEGESTIEIPIVELKDTLSDTDIRPGAGCLVPDKSVGILEGQSPGCISNIMENIEVLKREMIDIKTILANLTGFKIPTTGPSDATTDESFHENTKNADIVAIT